MAEMMAQGKQPEVLFWVGCAGSFDDRSKKITKAFVRILNRANVSFAVLGTEESCTGDPAKRAGNEFLFQMLAQANGQALPTENAGPEGQVRNVQESAMREATAPHPLAPNTPSPARLGGNVTTKVV